MLTFEQARQRVIEVATAHRPKLDVEQGQLAQVVGRILAEEAAADRDYPPFDRSTRDGYAVRSDGLTTVPAELEVLGEIRAGADVTPRKPSSFGLIKEGFSPAQCYQIMTGAGLPQQADAVVMQEDTERLGEDSVRVNKPVALWQNVVRRGSEAKAGDVLLRPGARLSYAELALLAQVGRAEVKVFARPRVAILSTGDEVVEVDEAPGPLQIRNSNTVSLAAQVTLAGGEPVPLFNAPDQEKELRQAIETGLSADALVLSGGVSMGKYDLVEKVLKEMGAEFFFDAVAIRPGKPAVFGLCRDKLVFGLPGNPVSTMVTFELFVVPALDILGGAPSRPLPTFKARLAAPVRQKAALTHFLPAAVEWTSGEAVVRELPWQGSGDIVALTRANAFLVVPQSKLEWPAGEWADVLPRRGML